MSSCSLVQAHIHKVKRRGDAAMAYIRHLIAQGKIVPVDQVILQPVLILFVKVYVQFVWISGDAILCFC